jgi:hypothetical protein
MAFSSSPESSNSSNPPPGTFVKKTWLGFVKSLYNWCNRLLTYSTNQADFGPTGSLYPWKDLVTDR